MRTRKIGKRYWRNTWEILNKPITALSVVEHLYVSPDREKVPCLLIEVEGQGFFTTSSKHLRNDLKALAESGIVPPFKCKLVQKGNSLHFVDVVPITDATPSTNPGADANADASTNQVGGEQA